MDPLSITAACIALGGAITNTSTAVFGFVRNVREARDDLEAVQTELSSIKTLLGLLADDVSDLTDESFPPTLQKQVADIIGNCTDVIADIDATLKRHNGSRVSQAARWIASGKDNIAKLRSSLVAHKSALVIALDMVALYSNILPIRDS